MEHFLTWLVLPSIALVAGGGFTVGFQTGDSNAPTAPTALIATAVSNSQIDLSWTASSDTFGVSGYRIFRDSAFLATSTLTTYNDTGLTASTSYSYTVSAFDATLNISAHSATATATTTDVVVVPTTTPVAISGDGSSGGCQPCYPCDTIRLNCDGGVGIFLPIAVSSLQVSSSISQLVLEWNNPVTPEFIGVRIIRSEKGFPQDAYDGALIFEGRGDVFIDRDVIAGKNYYYGVFAMYSDAIFAAPAVVSGLVLVDELIEEEVELFPGPSFELEEFNFKQDGIELEVVEGAVSVRSGIPIEVFLVGGLLPKEARVVVLDLSGVDGPVGSWVLVYNRETGLYHAILPALEAGNFSVQGSVYDNTFKLISSGGQSLLHVTDGAPSFSDFDTPKATPDWWWLWLLLLLLLILIYALFKRHDHDRDV